MGFETQRRHCVVSLIQPFLLGNTSGIFMLKFKKKVLSLYNATIWVHMNVPCHK